MSKKVIVCGYGGIGSAIVKKLLSDGLDVVVLSKTKVPDNEIIPSGSGRIEYHVADITDAGEVRDVMSKFAEESVGSLIFTSVSKLQRKSILQLSEEELHGDLSVTVFGFMNLVRAVLPKFDSSGGSITAVTTAALEPNRVVNNMGGYLAAKAALRQILRQLAVELGSRKIRVNAVAPGFVRTKLNSDVPERIDGFLKEKNLMNEMVTPHDVANAVSFLTSEEARAVTGTSLLVTYGEGMDL